MLRMFWVRDLYHAFGQVNAHSLDAVGAERLTEHPRLAARVEGGPDVGIMPGKPDEQRSPESAGILIPAPWTARRKRRS